MKDGSLHELMKALMNGTAEEFKALAIESSKAAKSLELLKGEWNEMPPYPICKLVPMIAQPALSKAMFAQLIGRRTSISCDFADIKKDIAVMSRIGNYTKDTIAISKALYGRGGKSEVLRRYIMQHPGQWKEVYPGCFVRSGSARKQPTLMLDRLHARGKNISKRTKDVMECIKIGRVSLIGMSKCRQRKVFEAAHYLADRYPVMCHEIKRKEERRRKKEAYRHIQAGLANASIKINPFQGGLDLFDI